MARTRTVTRKDESAAKRLKEARNDGWYNATSGLGTSRDKAANTVFVGGCVHSEAELTDLFRFNDLAKTAVSELPKDALRLPPCMKVAKDGEESQDSDETKERALAKLLRQHKVFPKLLLGRIWGRLYGRGAVVLDVTGAGGPETPWEPGRGKIRGMFVASGPELRVKSYYSDTMSEKFSEPATFWLTRHSLGAASAAIEIHESRMILFGGVPTPAQARAENMGADDSVIVAAFEALRLAGANWQSVSSMMADLSVAVYKLQGFIDSLAGEGKTVLARRFAEMDQNRAINRCVAVDMEGEDFEFKERGAMSGLDGIIQAGWLRVAAAFHMPVTKLMGQSPAGLNATGESDQTIWYDQCESERSDVFAPALTHICNALDPSAEWEPEWPSLWQETDKEKWERLEKQSNVDKTYVDAGILMPEEVAMARFKKGNELGIEVDPDVREELLENAHEEALNPPDPLAQAQAGALGAQPGKPGAGAGKGAPGAAKSAVALPEAD
jgi:phage-related protein (TIGR01555 family)